MSNGIHEAMAAIMHDTESITKARKNEQQKYMFRGIDDVYNAMHGIMVSHKVVMLPEVSNIQREERPSKSGGVLIYTTVTVRYTFMHSDGSSVQCVVVGEGMDSGDKSCNKAMSAAQKYALFQTFLIPTDAPKDSELDSPEVAAPDYDDIALKLIDHIRGIKAKPHLKNYMKHEDRKTDLLILPSKLRDSVRAAANAKHKELVAQYKNDKAASEAVGMGEPMEDER